MLQTRVGKITTIAAGLLGAVVVLMVASKMHFPFLHPRESLNGYLEHDFSRGLPASAVVEESYWVGFRDSEAVFQIQMPPQDAVAYVEKLRGIAQTKTNWRTTDLDVQTSRPFYDPAAWWNNPPLTDGQAVDFVMSEGTELRCHYLVLYSPGTGKMYWVRGGR